MQSRIRLFAIVYFSVFLLVVFRLFYWQIIKGNELSSQARGQYQNGFTLSARRGNIFAEDGSWLTSSKEIYLLYASIRELKEPPQVIAAKIAPLLINTDANGEEIMAERLRLESLLSKKNSNWIPLKQKLSETAKTEVENLKINGLGFEKAEGRAYPEASMAAHLLGFVGKDTDGTDLGYFGLEGYYDSTLTGKSGFISRETDARGIPIMLGETQEISAIKGIDLLTSISKPLQLNIEAELKKGIEKYKSKSGTVIVMDPHTGHIVAMASYPAYEPEYYNKYSDELFGNPAIALGFEPGSVFKVVVMASGLDAGVIRPDTICDNCSGPVQIDKYTIGTWNDQYYPNTNMTDVIVHSDNVGMVYVARKLGADRLYDYLHKFGIGETTGIDLQGEMVPKLRERGKWNAVDLATASFGQGVAVTPLQMIRAVSVIANGGLLVTPSVVTELRGEGWNEKMKIMEMPRIISEKASREITAMMVEAAESGESKWTYLKGFRVAGKTGTAQIPIAGHYDAERTIASFVGFAPFSDPKFVMLVILREPETSQWASETAAPLWYSIAKDLFAYYNIQPDP